MGMNVHTVAVEILAALEESVTVERDDSGMSVNHAAWMLQGIASGYVQHEKAHRWLGYAQGLLVVHGAATLEQMKEVNRNA